MRTPGSTAAAAAAKRTTPVQYQRLDGRLALVAANRGSPNPPAWWLNLQAEPGVGVQICAEASSFRARTAGPDERQELWPRLVEGNRWLPKVERKASRELPLVLLEDLTPDQAGRDAPPD